MLDIKDTLIFKRRKPEVIFNMKIISWLCHSHLDCIAGLSGKDFSQIYSFNQNQKFSLLIKSDISITPTEYRYSSHSSQWLSFDPHDTVCLSILSFFMSNIPCIFPEGLRIQYFWEHRWLSGSDITLFHWFLEGYVIDAF